MLIIGVVLLVAAVVVGIDVAAQNQVQVDVEAFNHVWTSSPSAAFIAGVVTAIVGVLGVFLMLDGGARSRRKRREGRAVVSERDHLAAERAEELSKQAKLREDQPALDLSDREPKPAAVETEPERHGIFHRAHR